MEIGRAKIALLHYTATPVIGGVENVISAHTRVFTDAGYMVRIIAGRGTESKQECAETVIIPEIDSDNPKNREVADALGKGQVPSLFGQLEAEIKQALVPVLRDVGILIVHNVLNLHLNLPLTAALYALVERGHTPPTIAWCHDISRFVNSRSGSDQRFGFPWDRMRTYVREIQYVAVSSARQKNLASILGVAPERIKVIPNGVAPELLLGLSGIGQDFVRNHRLLEADLILLMPVRITRAKNIEFALQVTAELKKQGTNPRLIITGPPDPHEEDSARYFVKLLSLRSELGLGREVVFAYEGARNDAPVQIDISTIPEFYRISDVLFMPSHREGFGLPILEAGLLGTPIFASAIPAVREVGKKAVHLIKSTESASQVAARLRDWADTDEKHQLRRRIRRDYTWQGIFEHDIEPLIIQVQRSSKEQA